MLHLASNLSASSLAFLILTLFIGLAALLVVVTRRFLPWIQVDRENTDFGQIFGGAIGTMFALVFALVTIAVWQNYDRVDAGVGDEANCIHNIYRYLESYPPEMRDSSRVLLQSYLKEVIQVEWPSMKDGRQDPMAHQLITQLNTKIAAYRPANLGDAALHQEVLAQVSRYRALRHDRLKAGVAYLDTCMCISLVGGSLILLVFCSAWRMPSLRQHIFMASALGGSLGMIFFLMLAYNHPFAGPGAIGPDAFQALLDNHWDK